MSDSSQSWMVRNRFRIQTAALAVLLIGPLALFAALQAGIGAIAMVLGVIVVVAMAVILRVS